MCGRFVLRTPAPLLAQMFGVTQTPPVSERFNIAPTQGIVVVRVLRPGSAPGTREMVNLRWGLIPPWADSPAIGNRMINARAESVAEKAAFRMAFRERRCLILADGFYEWQKTGGKKQPYCIGLKDRQPFAFAGLWESWTAPDGEIIESCTMITTEANAAVEPVHSRMPVILDPKDYDRWLDANTEPDELKAMLRPYPADEMVAYPVSQHVNSPRNENPGCATPMG